MRRYCDIMIALFSMLQSIMASTLAPLTLNDTTTNTSPTRYSISSVTVTTESNDTSVGTDVTNTSLADSTTNFILTKIIETITDKSEVFSSTLEALTTFTGYASDETSVLNVIQNINLTKPHNGLQTNPSVATTTVKSSHPDLNILMGRDSDDADIQALAYVFAVVIFYGLVLIVALMGMRVRKRRLTRLDEGYAALIDRNEVVRRDTVLRHKMNVLRLGNVHYGYLLDQLPEHSVWCV